MDSSQGHKDSGSWTYLKVRIEQHKILWRLRFCSKTRFLVQTDRIQGAQSFKQNVMKVLAGHKEKDAC